MTSALDKDVPVPLDPDVQFFNYLVDAYPWVDRKFGIDLAAAMHRLDLQRAGKSPAAAPADGSPEAVNGPEQAPEE